MLDSIHQDIAKLNYLPVSAWAFSGHFLGRPWDALIAFCCCGIMGRRAKYLTQDEKFAGANRRRKEAASTAQYVIQVSLHSCISSWWASGQTLRKAQNQRAYELRKALAPPKPPKVSLPAFSNPSLSAELIALTDFPTPQSRIFRSAFQSSDALDDTDYSDSELAKWDCLPPYEHHFIPKHPDRLADALHGYRRRRQHEAETQRLRQYKTEPLTNFAIKLHAELVRRHEFWKKIRAAMVGIPGHSILGQLGMELLRWEARCVWHLEKDLASLRDGSDTFLRLYVDRWS
ncbi:hypothetical protein FPV67DRAFT_1672819 [Lyophyllum atratum]|nr:hypothetical protein FPV67DRAFT_1672819 [Lyophyllum atratum]